MQISRPPLAQHQLEGFDWIRNGRARLLADEPGLGKSRQAISSYDGGRNLVIAPAMVLDGGTWDDELKLWSDFPDRWATASFTGLNVREKTPGGGNRPVPGKPRPEFQGPWDAIVVDEAHYIKNAGTNWTETIEALAAKTDAVLLMTGTPISNWAPDLFTTLRVLNPDESKPGKRYGSRWRWLGEWFDVQPSRFGGANARVVGELLACTKSCLLLPAHQPCVHYQEFMQANLGDDILRRLAEDVLDLPPLTEQTVKTPMNAAQKRMYRELKADFATTTKDGDTFEAWSSGSQINMMQRLTTSEWLIDKKGLASGGKFDTLREDLRNRSRPTLVFAHYRDSVEGCASVAEQLGLRTAYIHGGTPRTDRRSIVAEFKAGRLDVLVGSLETVAEGLTLTQADMAIFVEQSFKPSRNRQARDRIYRMGQTRHTHVRKYLTPLSLDSAKDRVLATKTDRQMRMLSARQFLELM